MITIQEMQLDDLEQVAEIERQNFSVPWTENGFFSFLLRSDTLFLVAKEEDQILGYMGIMMVLDEGEITNVSVAQTARRRGVGRLLVQTMLDKMRRAGLTMINTPAIRLYEQFAFVQDGERKNYYEEPTEDAVLMSCRLK